MSENIKVENNTPITNQTNIFIENMSGNIGAPDMKKAPPSNDSGAIKNIYDFDSISSNEYYNLIVAGYYDPSDTSFNRTRIVLAKDRVIETGYTTQDIVEMFGELNEKAIAKVKMFPSIFAFESRLGDYPKQIAYYGFITDIKFRDNGVHIYFRKVAPLSQKRLDEIERELALHRFDLTHTHWAIKKVDLIEELTEAGFFETPISLGTEDFVKCEKSAPIPQGAFIVSGNIAENQQFIQNATFQGDNNFGSKPDRGDKR